MKIKFFNIQWDTDGATPESCGLPKETPILVVSNDFDAEMEGADLLSDKYGFCVSGFDFKVISDSKINQVFRVVDGVTVDGHTEFIA